MNDQTPTFIIIGAAKSGTTSLASYLSQHPEICISRKKEARYFAYNGDLPDYLGYGVNGQTMMDGSKTQIPPTWSEYQELFDAAEPNQITGEASPAYIYIEGTAQRIYERLPNAKIIVILRNPVRRAYSSFLHMKRTNSENYSFKDALKNEEKRIAENSGLPWRYIDMGYYGKQLTEYYNLFNPDQIKVIFQEDLDKKTEETMEEIYTFLEKKSTTDVAYNNRMNRSGVPTNRFIFNSANTLIGSKIAKSIKEIIPKKITTSLKKAYLDFILKRPQLDQKLYATEIMKFKDDNKVLESLIGRQTPWSKEFDNS